MSIIVTLPLRVKTSKNKFFIINLNEYRNAYFRTLSAAKNEFHRLVSKLVEPLPVLEGRVAFLYTVYFGSNREFDVANVCSIEDKFFSDTMVKCGKIKDDNYKFLPEVGYRFGGIDPTNPRVEVEIFPTGERPTMRTKNLKDDDMRITLTEEENKEAVIEYLTKRVSIPENQTYNIDYVNGRGDNGLTTNIDITKPQPRRRAEYDAPTEQPVVGQPKTAEESQRVSTPVTQTPTPVAPTQDEQEDEVADDVIHVEEVNVPPTPFAATAGNPFANSSHDEDQGQGGDDDSNSGNEVDEVTQEEPVRDEEPAVLEQPEPVAQPVVQERKSLFDFKNKKK